jgi:hypothetical protein
MKTYWGKDVWLSTSLHTLPCGGEWFGLSKGPLSPREYPMCHALCGRRNWLHSLNGRGGQSENLPSLHLVGILSRPTGRLLTILTQLSRLQESHVTRKKVKLSLCLTKHWGSGGIAPRIIHLGNRRRRAVSFTPRPLYPQGKSPWYPLDRRLGGLQSRSGRSSKEKISVPPPGIEP